MKVRTGLHFPWRRISLGSARAQLRDFITSLAYRALDILELAERKSFLESEIQKAFRFHRVEILSRPEGAERFSASSTRVRDLLSRLSGILEGTRKPFLNVAVAKEIGVSAIMRLVDATYVFPIRKAGLSQALLLVDSSPREDLGRSLEKALLDVCSQLAVVLENSNLIRKKLELERALAKQAQIVQLGEMAARIAHEIRNPLSAIKTIVQVMREDAGLSLKYSQDLDLITGEIDRLADSVSRLLDYARPLPEQQQTIHLRAEAEAALSFLSRDLKQHRVVVENKIPAELPPLTGSAGVFREIFLNLVLNAMQAGGDGTHIWLRAQEGELEDRSECFVLLVVEDDGPGIQPEAREKIFTPFFTTKQRGTGLGLAIVKRNVEYLGGHVAVESPAREVHGTRFLLHFPVS